MVRTARATPVIALVALLAGLGLTVACTDRSAAARAPAAGPIRGGTLVASLRSEPGTFNRYVEASSASEALSQLTQARLVRINRATDALEPWLAERWSTSPDGRTYTLTLRHGVTFSDGAPFTSADVVFSFRVLYDPEVQSEIASGAEVQGKPLVVTAPDAETVVVSLPAPFSPGLRMLDNVPILPKHLLESAYNAHHFREAWGLTTAPRSMAGLGPFVVSEHVPAERITLTRNPHYWRTDAAGVPLPYLDSLVIQILSDQNAEMLRLEAGSLDMLMQSDVRPGDYAALRRLRDEGKLALVDVGVSLDPNMLWFNLTPVRAAQARRPWLQRTEFHQAISYAVDRTAIINTVYLGAAVPVYGPVSPGNMTWYSDAAPKYPHDIARAKALLAGIGLTDRQGTLVDPSGAPVRFSILSQRGHIRERVAAVIQEQLRQVGISVDLVSLDVPSLVQHWQSGEYDSIYFGNQASATDPANNLDLWLSSGSNHFWNPSQRSPATPWEKQIDELMQRQVAAPTLPERQRLFAEVQRILGENLPAIYFVAPRVSIAMSNRIGGAVPALLEPRVLWQSETLYVRGGAAASGR